MKEKLLAAGGHLFPFVPSSASTTCGGPAGVPSWLGGCRLRFRAALDVDNEKLQTSLPLITGRSAGIVQPLLSRMS